ncbi:fimbrial protein [Stenotrophomonas sp. SY1]|uniref:fimbrial protein n=1 Tax=Stenotrophomonas sp. SY1 TaxID=477235 RepID=UPI001E315ADA|nr:fimbrial protein [Stenotrophomonas sp. SY1]MCD9085425.1 type 1 fimbrial protein [Stenotrophomonas sp. SY1]
MNKLSLASALALALLAAPAAYAADGTIEFTGNVTAVTCTINGGSADFNVVLPTVSAGSLATEGDVAGRTPFKIEVSGCTPDTGSISAFFEADAQVNSQGRLDIDAGGAKNVEVALLNDSHNEIMLGASGNQGSQKVSLAGGSAVLNYYAQYYSLGGAEAGAVATRVRYTMSYE